MDSNLVLMLEIAAALGVLFIALVIFLVVRPKRSTKTEARLPAGVLEAGRVLYDTRSGSVSLDLDGKTLQSRSDLTPDQDKAFGSFYKLLSGWYGQVPPAPVKPSSVESPAPMVDTPIPEQVAQPVAQPAHSSVMVQPVVQAPVEVAKPAGGLIDGIVRAVQADVRDPIRIKSIAEQIDDVLQEQMKTSPLEKRGIRMANDLDGGVLIWVGLDKFHGIDEIKDPEVQAAIRAAAAEWRRRTA